MIALPLASILMAQQPYTRQLTVKDGLPSMTVYDIFQDSKDYIWLGTDKGLCRYDGQGFRYYYNKEQKGSSIDGLTEDKNGRLWCKNFNSQLFYIEKDSMHHFDKVDTVLGGSAMASFAIDCENRLWFHTNDSIWYYNLDKNRIYSFSLGTILEVYQMKKSPFQELYTKSVVAHIVAIKTNDCEALVSHWSTVGFQILNKNIKRDNCPLCRRVFIEDLIIPCLLKANIGQNKDVFFIEHPERRSLFPDRYLLYRRKEDGEIVPLPRLNHSLQKIRPIGITSDFDGKIWVYTYDGVFYQNTLEADSVHQLFKGIQVSKVLQDREGNHWFSTLDNGLFIMPNIETVYSNQFNSALKDHRIKLLATIDSSKLILGTASNEHPVLNIESLELKDWLKTLTVSVLEALEYNPYSEQVYLQQNGIIIFNKKDGKRIDNFTDFPNIKDFHFFENGYLLYASRVGAHLAAFDLKSAIDNRLLAHIKQEKMAISNHYYNVLFHRVHDKYQRCNTVFAEDFEHFWLGYSDTLMYFYDGKMYPILTKDGLNVRASQIVKTTDGIIWVSTNDQGLFGINQQRAFLYHFDKSNQLVSNNILSLKVDNKGLWIGTDKGLQYLEEDHKTFRTYDQSDGLASNEINDIEILGGKVWLATNEGLISFNKNMPSTNDYAPPIYLSGIAINGVDTLLATKYELAYHRNNFFISFQGIAYRSQGNFSYKYRMQGLSEEWITVNSAQNELRFMSLNPGEYHLEIYALNEDGVESKKPIIIDFLIHPPYWQTWWFWSLIGGGLLLIAGGITYWQFTVYRRRQALLLQMQQLRTQALQSQMNPHFIFNAMNAIQKLMVKDTMENALGYMAKFAKLIRMIFEISGQQSIPLEEEISFLKLYLDLEKLRFKDKVTIEFQIDEALLDDFYFIPPLLIQPIIENSFKHGLMHKETPGYLKIEFKKENSYLYVCVEDNGVGRKRAAELSEWKQEKRTKSGLIVTKERLSMLTAHPNHPQNFLITDLSDGDGAAAGLRTELWISFSLENGDNES